MSYYTRAKSTKQLKAQGSFKDAEGFWFQSKDDFSRCQDYNRPIIMYTGRNTYSNVPANFIFVLSDTRSGELIYVSDNNMPAPTWMIQDTYTEDTHPEYFV